MSQTLTQTAKITAIRVKATNKHIFRALLSLSSAALFVRVAGMVNQVVSSSHFGAGPIMDAYFVAYTLPTVLASLITGSLDAAVIPAYSLVRSQGSKEQASRFFSTILNLFALSSLLLTILLIVFHRQMILLTAPALDPLRANAAANLALFMDPVLFLMVVVGLLECIFNVEGQFGWPAYAGILVPLTSALLVVFMGNSQGIVVLCVGMVIGLCLQLGVFIIRAKRAQLVYRLVLDLRTPEMSSIFIVIWPVFLGGLIVQASPLVDQIFASLLSAGSISALSYSLKIVSVFSGVIFASVGRAVLPFLSRQAAANDMRAFKATLRLYLWAVGLGTAVLSVLMLLLAHPIVQILFQRGAFTADDTNRTATTFIGFVFGLTPMALGFVGARAFSALGKNRVLIGVSAFSVVANAVFDYIFAHFWQSQGIALSTSAVYFCTMFILFITLSRMVGKINLLTPPIEVIQLVNKIKLSLLSFFLGQRLQVIRISIAMVIFAVGIIGTLLNSLYTLRISLGSIVILAFLRYRYALLITWVIIDAFIGSMLPIFNGNNFDTALSIPTLLLMTCMPLQQTFKRMPVLAFFLVYLLWVFAGIGISPLAVGAFLTQWILLLVCIATAVLAIHVLTTQQRLMRFIDIIMLPTTFVALYGIYGYFTKQNGQIDPSTLLFRSYSIFSAAPAAALYLSSIIPLAIYRATTLQGFKRIGISTQVIIYLVALVLTFTRAAFISLPLSITIMILFMPSRRVKLGLFSSILVLAVIAFLLARSGNIPIFDRFLNQDISTFNNRTYLWQALLDHFDPRQLLGNGLQASYTLLINLQITKYGSSSSNLFIGVLYDEGIIGLALLILVFIVLFVSLIKGIRKTSGSQRALFVVALATFVNMLLYAFDANDLWNQSIGLYFWIIMALPFAVCWSLSKQSTKAGQEFFGTAEEFEQALGIPAGQASLSLSHIMPSTSSPPPATAPEQPHTPNPWELNGLRPAPSKQADERPALAPAPKQPRAPRIPLRVPRAWQPGAVFIVLAVLISLVIGAGFWSHARSGLPAAHSATPVPTVRHSTPTPTLTATSVSSIYPTLVGTYNGTIGDLSVNVSTSISLTGIRQSQGNISGYLVLGPKMQGSGPFGGTIDTNKHIQFIVTDAAGHATLFFEGQMQSATSLSGDFYSCSPVGPVRGGRCSQAPGSYGIWNVVLSP